MKIHENIRIVSEFLPVFTVNGGRGGHQDQEGCTSVQVQLVQLVVFGGSLRSLQSVD